MSDDSILPIPHCSWSCSGEFGLDVLWPSSDGSWEDTVKLLGQQIAKALEDWSRQAKSASEEAQRRRNIFGHDDRVAEMLQTQADTLRHCIRTLNEEIAQ